MNDMEQFNLEEYLRNPNRKIITRDGRSVRIICTDRNPDRYPVDGYGNYPIIALVQGEFREDVLCYTENGLFLYGSEEKEDLFFDPKGRICPFKEGDRVLVRDSDTSWKFDVFQDYDEKARYPYICLYAPYEQCIPLNENTWKLLGTTTKYEE